MNSCWRWRDFGDDDDNEDDNDNNVDIVDGDVLSETIVVPV